ncbi:MAG: ATP-binding protein [Spirochaetaceae bacterium]|jgi:PAS domain-containing protein|nr:ATP-binding protein [Spirochaetaceae bacterium]
MESRLPLGVQTFSEISEDGLAYADKTKRIYRLVTGSGKFVFLARPHRFGKSLLCSTLVALFEGRRELFAGFEIDKLDWKWKKHPVIHINLKPANYFNGTAELLSVIRGYLREAARKAGVQLIEDTVSSQFARLIHDAYKECGERAVVIIDDYDKPLLDTMDRREIHEALKNELRGFYGVLKSSDEYLRFVFVTGITNFSRVSAFPQLNTLNDISFNPAYCDLCGVTQEEMEIYFAPEINHIVSEIEEEKYNYFMRLTRFYNGYRFSESNITVYNPCGLLNHFYNRGKFKTYCFASGVPEFLIKLMAEQNINIVNLESSKVSLVDFQVFDPEKMNVLVLLYQLGYLTISDYNDEAGLYILNFPNYEVHSAFARSLLGYYCKISGGEYAQNALLFALVEGGVDDVMSAVWTTFAYVSDMRPGDEAYYKTVVYLLFRALGLFFFSDLRVYDKWIDAVIETKKYVYCFVFGLADNAEEALDRIDGSDYPSSWKDCGKKLFRIGVGFDYEKQNIKEWRVAK